MKFKAKICPQLKAHNLDICHLRFVEQDPGPKFIKKFQNSTVTLHWNNTLWLKIVTWLATTNQSSLFHDSITSKFKFKICSKTIAEF